MLQHQIKDDLHQRQWQNYVADTVGALAIRIFRQSGAENFEMPLFSELSEKKKQKKLTAEEIKQNIIHKLTKKQGKGG